MTAEKKKGKRKKNTLPPTPTPNKIMRSIYLFKTLNKTTKSCLKKYNSIMEKNIIIVCFFLPWNSIIFFPLCKYFYLNNLLLFVRLSPSLGFGITNKIFNFYGFFTWSFVLSLHLRTRIKLGYKNLDILKMEYIGFCLLGKW